MELFRPENLAKNKETLELLVIFDQFLEILELDSGHFYLNI